MKELKQTAAVGVILVSILVLMFLLMYQEYEYTSVRKERIKASAAISMTELNTALYKSLKREAQEKVDKVAEEIRAELLKNYSGDMASFINDYEAPTEGSILLNAIDSAIHSEEDRFFHVESDANDMFVLSKYGVVSDKSQDCSAFGITRTFDNEIYMHADKRLAKQAIDAMLSGSATDVFWRFRNSTPATKVQPRDMDIDTLLKLPISQLKDYEFLTVAYIDKYGDILGTPDVTTGGEGKETKKLIIVQGFNLYEQVRGEFKESYLRLEKSEKLQLALLEENKTWLRIKAVVSIGSILISLFAISAIQNLVIKGRGECDNTR